MTKDDEHNHRDGFGQKRIFLFDGHHSDETRANEEYETAQEIPGEQGQPLEESSSVHDHQNAGNRQYCDHRVDLRGDHSHSQHRQDQREQASRKEFLHAMRGIGRDERADLAIAIAQELAELGYNPRIGPVACRSGRNPDSLGPNLPHPKNPAT